MQTAEDRAVQARPANLSGPLVACTPEQATDILETIVADGYGIGSSPRQLAGLTHGSQGQYRQIQPMTN